MKKFLAILLALSLLLLAGCSGKSEEVTEAPETTESVTEAPATEAPVETEAVGPETVSATIKVDRTPVVLTTADRGDTLDVVDEYDDDHYVVKLELGYGLVEKRLARLDSEPAYEQWTGYAMYGAKLHSTYRLLDEEPVALQMNEELTVLDSLGDVLVVQMGDTIGYVLADQVSPYFVTAAPGGSGGGGADGGDIYLRFQGGITLLGTFVPQEGEVSGTATALADGTPILLGWFDRNDSAQVVTEAGAAEEKEGYVTVYLDGLYGYIQQNLVALEGEGSYEEWDGYAAYNAVLYDNYDLRGDPIQKLNANTDIHVLEDLGNCYLVTVGDVTGYMAKDHVSEFFVTYSGGGSGGAEWTPPAL